MAKEIRIKRVESFVKSEIAQILQNELRDEGIKGLVSVFGVEVSKDLRHAKIKISIFADSEKDLKSTVRSLIKAKSFIRRRISKSLKTMYAPELYFEFIDLSQADKVYKILKEIERELEDEAR